MSQEPCAPERARATADAGEFEAAAIDRREQARTLYEMRVDAMLALVTGPKRARFDADAVHRVVEAYASTEHENLPYYDRWLKAIRGFMVEQGVLTDAEIDACVAAIKARDDAAGQPC
jgi:hypothetical protein